MIRSCTALNFCLVLTFTKKDSSKHVFSSHLVNCFRVQTDNRLITLENRNSSAVSSTCMKQSSCVLRYLSLAGSGKLFIWLWVSSCIGTLFCVLQADLDKIRRRLARQVNITYIRVRKQVSTYSLIQFMTYRFLCRRRFRIWVILLQIYAKPPPFLSLRSTSGKYLIAVYERAIPLFKVWIER